MKRNLFLVTIITAVALSLNSCVETCEGECDIDENGKLDCPCDN